MPILGSNNLVEQFIKQVREVIEKMGKQRVGEARKDFELLRAWLSEGGNDLLAVVQENPFFLRFRDDRLSDIYEFLGLLIDEDPSTSIREVEGLLWWFELRQK